MHSPILAAFGVSITVVMSTTLTRRGFCSATAMGLAGAGSLLAQNGRKLRIIAFGAHPDDCDIRVGGCAALWAQMGHDVKFVACTNGDAGHPVQGGAPLARRRRAEATEAARRIGITTTFSRSMTAN